MRDEALKGGTGECIVLRYDRNGEVILPPIRLLWVYKGAWEGVDNVT